jgi:hypothetical protein
MPPPIALPSDALQVSDNEDAPKVITAPEVNPSLPQQHHDDPFDSSDRIEPKILLPMHLAPGNVMHVSDQDESTIPPLTIDNHREVVCVNNENHSEADTVNVTTDGQEVSIPSDRDNSKVTSSALHLKHDSVCITTEEDEDDLTPV